MPHPVVYQETQGLLELPDVISVDTENIPDPVKEFFVEKLTKVFKTSVVFSREARHIRFKRTFNTPKDHYTLSVQNDVVITYSSDESCFYAINSLLQLIKSEENKLSIQHCFIQDHPKFSWRGLHLDVSRHFFSVEEVKRYIDLMALYKFNTFHWHLTDDQGWRIQIKKYPKLTEIGGWRDSTVNNHYSTLPRTYSHERYGGYYTQDEIREVVNYASKRYITVVPEIEMPGHSRAALAAYPEYSCTGKQWEVPGLWGVFDDIFCSHESTFLFLEDILDEVLDLFPSTYIHIGGDEAPKTRWKQCKKCQAVIRENGLKDEHALQSFFIKRMDRFLTSRGRKLIGWDEILEGGLSPNATVMSWRGFEGGLEAAKQKHYVVMSPGSHCYFDHYQSTNSHEPLAIGGYTSLEKVYQFEPVPETMSPDDAAYVLGAQANLWTEYIPDMKQLEYMTYPRALALSQVLWCQSKPAFQDFKNTFIHSQMDFLSRFNVNYSQALFYPEMEIKRNKKGVNIHFKGAENGYHFDLFVKSDEQIPAMNGGQVVGQLDTLYFERTEGKKVVKYAFRVTSDYSTKPSLFEFYNHPAVGLPIALNTFPNPRYKGNWSLTLVDGIRGSRPWKGHEWLGFDTSTIELILNLERKTAIEGLEIGFLRDEGSWIHLPKTVQLFTSSNQRKWKPLRLKDGKQAPVQSEAFKLNLKAKGKYLKFVIHSDSAIPDGLPGAGNQPWIFMDEIIVYQK